MLRLLYPATDAGTTFWWFFVSATCWRHLRVRGMFFDQRNIVDRKIIVINNRGGGPHAETTQYWPCLSDTNTMINAGSNEWFGLGGYYSPPPSSDSEGTSSWLDLLEE